MNDQNTASRRLSSWFRSFRTSKNSSNGPTKLVTTQNSRFARTFRRSLGSKLEGNSEATSGMKSDQTRASLMSIRKIWAADAEIAAKSNVVVERKSKKPCAKVDVVCSQSRIPISLHMKVQHGRSLFSEAHAEDDKENNRAEICSSSGDSLGSSQSSKMVVKAAVLAKNRRSSCGCHGNSSSLSEQEIAFKKSGKSSRTSKDIYSDVCTQNWGELSSSSASATE